MRQELELRSERGKLDADWRVTEVPDMGDSLETGGSASPPIPLNSALTVSLDGLVPRDAPVSHLGLSAVTFADLAGLATPAVMACTRGLLEMFRSGLRAIEVVAR